MFKFKKILFPTDFSDHATQALGYAIAFADKFNSELTALHVIALFQDDPNNPLHQFPDLNAFYASVEKDAAQKMETLQKMSSKVKVKKMTIRGISPAEEIVNIADDHQIDLIVMGTHGRSAIGNFLLGSVAEKVIRHAHCPVLTVSHHEKDMHHVASIQRIVVPLDFSEPSRESLKYAVDLAKAFDAAVDFLHVADQRVHPSYYVMGEQSIFQIHPDLLEKSKSYLERFVRTNVPENLKAEFYVREGNPHSEIIKFARSQNADLILMATHGLTGLERLLIGSTTDKVVRKTDVPVLAVKPSLSS